MFANYEELIRAFLREELRRGQINEDLILLYLSLIHISFINSLSENTIKGHMLVSVFGGGTSNSEYEFLTGNSVSSLPLNGNAYTQFVKHKVPSLASQLKQQGYDTLAFHPYKAHGRCV